MKVSPGATQARGRADQNGSARVGAYARMLCRWLDDEVLMEVISPTAAWLYCVLTMTSARAESDGWLSRRQAQRAVSTEDGSDLEELLTHGLLQPIEADEEHVTPGYLLTRYASEQRLSDRIEAERQKSAQRQAKHRASRKSAKGERDDVSSAVTRGGTNGVSHGRSNGVTNGVSHAPSSVQCSAVQDSAVEDRDCAVPGNHDPSTSSGGHPGLTEAVTEHGDPWRSPPAAPDHDNSPSHSGRAVIFAGLADEPEDALTETGGSGWWERPLTDEQCFVLIGAGMHPERVVTKMRALAVTKRWREIDWARVVGSQKIDKDTALQRGEKTRLTVALGRDAT